MHLVQLKKDAAGYIIRKEAIVADDLLDLDPPEVINRDATREPQRSFSEGGDSYVAEPAVAVGDIFIDDINCAIFQRT